MNKRVFVGMSGGVDSAVSAYLLQRDYEVTGVGCRFFAGAEPEPERSRAKRVCDRLGIDFISLDLTDSFKTCVIDYFISEYERARTPNPCIECNRTMKFSAMLDFALENGADMIATGHYARVQYDRSSGRWLLKKGADLSKDQSYVLYSLSQKSLSHTVFPLGELKKAQVKQIAGQLGLVDEGTRESQDICFVPDGDYAAFIRRRTGRVFSPGDFIDTDGRVLGRHKGIICYTVGQRRGLGIAAPQPLYVMKKDSEKNTVTLCTAEKLFSKRVVARRINLICTDSLTGEVRLSAKIRYNRDEQPATVRQTGSDELTIDFDTPQRAPCAGQSVVLYDGDTVVGGGIIE